MEQSHRVFGNEGAVDSSSLYALKSAEKIVKRVSKQLARPNVAGFQARLDREDFQALLKHVSSEKIEVLLDEFMVQVCVPLPLPYVRSLLFSPLSAVIPD